VSPPDSGIDGVVPPACLFRREEIVFSEGRIHGRKGPAHPQRQSAEDLPEIGTVHLKRVVSGSNLAQKSNASAERTIEPLNRIPKNGPPDRPTQSSRTLSSNHQ